MEVSSGNGVAPRRVLYSASSNILGACQCERRTHRKKCFHILALKIQNVNTKHKNFLVARLARPDLRKYPLELGNIHLLNCFHVFDAGASRRRNSVTAAGGCARRRAPAQGQGQRGWVGGNSCRNGFDMIQSQPLYSSFKLIISFTFSSLMFKSSDSERLDKFSEVLAEF